MLTDHLSAEKEVTISSVIPTLRHIDTLCQHGPPDVEQISNDIKDSILRYFKTRLTDKALLLFLCIGEVMDPRYLVPPTQTSNDDDEEVDSGSLFLELPSQTEVRRELIQLCINFAPQPDPDPTQSTSTATSMSHLGNEPPQKKAKSLVELLLSKRRPAASDVTSYTSTEQRVRRELNFYEKLPPVSSSSDVLQWWKAHSSELPLLANLAKYILCCAATSVASERLFSLSGHIVSKRRNSLKPSMVDMLVFLAFNCNKL